MQVVQNADPLDSGAVFVLWNVEWKVQNLEAFQQVLPKVFHRLVLAGSWVSADQLMNDLASYKMTSLAAAFPVWEILALASCVVESHFFSPPHFFLCFASDKNMTVDLIASAVVKSVAAAIDCLYDLVQYTCLATTDIHDSRMSPGQTGSQFLLQNLQVSWCLSAISVLERHAVSDLNILETLAYPWPYQQPVVVVAAAEDQVRAYLDFVCFD